MDFGILPPIKSSELITKRYSGKLHHGVPASLLRLSHPTKAAIKANAGTTFCNILVNDSIICRRGNGVALVHKIKRRTSCIKEGILL